MAKHKKIICKKCKKEKIHECKGFCKNCYIKNKYHTDKIERKKVLERNKKWREKNKEKFRKIYYEWSKNNKEKIKKYRIKSKENRRKYQKKYREENIKKFKAYRKLYNLGNLPKQEEYKCNNCKKPAEVFHHPDYSKPLIVIPLCNKCHSRLHKGLIKIEQKVIYIGKSM